MKKGLNNFILNTGACLVFVFTVSNVMGMPDLLAKEKAEKAEEAKRELFDLMVPAVQYACFGEADPAEYGKVPETGTKNRHLLLVTNRQQEIAQAIEALLEDKEEITVASIAKKLGWKTKKLKKSR